MQQAAVEHNHADVEQNPVTMKLSYSVSGRAKKTDEAIGQFLETHFAQIRATNIDSIYAFVERSTLYGGRQFLQPELSGDDIAWLEQHDIGIKLPLSNHMVSEDEYEANRPLLEKYHREGNAVVVVNDKLAYWIRRDYPLYSIEASVIKHIDNHDNIEEALEIYHTVVLPMRLNTNLKFLKTVRNKDRIRLFSNGGCAYTCPLHLCYKSISKLNKFNDDEQFHCSQKILFRPLLGMINFDVSRLQQLGFNKFKILRSR